MNFGIRMVNKPEIDHCKERTAPGNYLFAFPDYTEKYPFLRDEKRLKTND